MEEETVQCPLCLSIFPLSLSLPFWRTLPQPATQYWSVELTVELSFGRDWTDMCGGDQAGSQLHQGHIKTLTEFIVVRVDDDPADVQKVLCLVEVYFPHLDPVQGWVGVMAVGDRPWVAQRQLVREESCLHSTPSRCPPVCLTFGCSGQQSESTEGG